MIFFHPCRDVFQAAWDPCSYRWIIWLKREIELCVISVAMVWEAMCLYDGSQWCSVCGEEEGSKNRSMGNPSDQLMCFGYLPSPGHLERPTSEIGFKPAKWNPSDIQWWEGGQEDLMIDSVKSGGQIQQNEDWWFGIAALKMNDFRPLWRSRCLRCERTVMLSYTLIINSPILSLLSMTWNICVPFQKARPSFPVSLEVCYDRQCQTQH